MDGLVRNLTWTLVQMTVALSGAQWGVDYPQTRICAVKGSSVAVPCSFYFPGELAVQRVMWGHERFDVFQGPFIFDSEEKNTSSKFEYIGNKSHNCSFKIHQVDHNDTGRYAFRFETDDIKGKYTGLDGGPTLELADLRVNLEPNGNGATTEGDSVNLTCVSSCDCSQISSAFTWYKNGEPINEGCVLHLSNMSSTHSGNYTCSLKSHAGTTSAVRSIDVEYAPKNTSVEVEGGSNITLICSSHANPPVENYTWYKRNDDDDEADIVEVGHQPVFHPGAGGQYLCSAANKHGSQNSSVVTLTVEGYLSTFNRHALFICAALLIVAIVSAVMRIIIKKKSAPEAACEEDIQNPVYANWFISNPSQEGNQCDEATAGLIYSVVGFPTQSESNTEQQMDSHQDDGGVIYSTVCR